MIAALADSKEANAPTLRGGSIVLNYLHRQVTDVAYPLQGITERVSLHQLRALVRRLLVRGQIADRLAGRGAAYRQQQKNITGTVLELAPQPVRGLSLEGSQIDHSSAHQVVLMAPIPVP